MRRDSTSTFDGGRTSTFSVSEAVTRWLDDGRAQGHSARTIKERQEEMDRFRWWIVHEDEGDTELAVLSPAVIRRFMAYLRGERPEGRWGNDHHATKREPRPATLHGYFRTLRAFANWCVAEGLVEKTFMQNVKPPRLPKDRIPPLSEDEVQRLLDAARRTQNPDRNVAILLLILDSGLRAGEVCSLNRGDLDRESGEIRVIGKGGKKRPVYTGTRSRRAIWRHMDAEGGKPRDPLFLSKGGRRPNERMTPQGIFRIVSHCGRLAGIKGAGPHDLRRTFAVLFLRYGGDLFSLQAVMGHDDLETLRGYVEMAERDTAEIHRANSPADRLKLR